MNTKTTLIVAVIALLLGAYFLIFETDLFDRQLTTTREREQKMAEQPPATGEPVFAADTIAPEKVRTMRVQIGNEEPAVFARQSDARGWVQTEPVHFDVQDHHVQGVIEAAAALRQTATVSVGSGKEALNPTEIGLNPPRAVVTLTGEDMPERTIVLGTRPGAGRAFVAVNDPAKINSAFIVGERLHDAVLGQPLRQWRSTSIAAGLLPGAAQQVTLKNSDQPAVVAKREDGRWMLAEPVKGRADRAAVEGLVNVLGGAVIDQFIADKPVDLAAFGLDQPSHVLTVQTSEEQSHQLTIGSPADLEQSKYFAMYNDVPVVFTLRKHDVERLNKTANDLRDARLTSVNPADISEITVKRQDQPDLHLVRDQGRWTFGEPKPRFALEPQAVEQLLQAITTTKAADYRDTTIVRLTAPIATVTLGISTRSEPEVLTLHGTQQDERITVLRQGESTGYIVPRQNLSMLLEPIVAYRDRTVLDIAQDQIAELHIQRSGEHPAEYHIVRAAPPEGESLGTWKLDGLDQPAIKRLLESLTPLRAESWITPKPGDADEQVQLRLKLADGVERVLTIDPGSRTAQLEGEPQPFLISEQLADLASSELRQRTVLSAGVEEIAWVEFDDVTINRTAQGRFTSEQGAVDEQKAAVLWDTLAGLQAQYFIDDSRLTGDPTVTMTISFVEEGQHPLLLWLPTTPANAPAIAHFGDRAFTLDRPTANAIVTNPLRGK